MQSTNSERKGVLSLLQRAHLRIYNVQSLLKDPLLAEEPILPEHTSSKQLEPLLVLSLDACIPLSMVPVAATIESICFATGTINIWILAKPDRPPMRATTQNDKSFVRLLSGRETERSRMITDRGLEDDRADQDPEPQNPTALGEEVFYVRSELAPTATRVVRCLLMNTHHLETLKSSSLIKSNYCLEVARHDGSIALLLRKGSELYLAVLLDMTELMEVPLVQFTLVWGKKHQVRFEDDIHPNISRFHGLPVLYTEESLICFDLKRLPEIANTVLADSASGDLAFDLSEFIFQLNAKLHEYYAEAIDPRYQQSSLRMLRQLGPKRADNDVLTTHLLLHRPLKMIPCPMTALLSLNQTTTIKSVLSEQQDQSSIVTPFIPAGFLNPPADKPQTVATAKQQLTDFKDHATTQLKLMLNAHNDVISLHAEQMCFELDGWKRSKLASDALNNRIEALLTQNRRIQALKEKVFGLVCQVAGKQGFDVQGAFAEIGERETKFVELSCRARESLAEIKAVRQAIKGLLERLYKVEFKFEDRARLDETINNLRGRLKALRKAHHLPEPKPTQTAKVLLPQAQHQLPILPLNIVTSQRTEASSRISASGSRDSVVTINKLPGLNSTLLN